MIRQNRITVCPECRGKLSTDKQPYISNTGDISRIRVCMSCGNECHTKHNAEYLTNSANAEI